MEGAAGGAAFILPPGAGAARGRRGGGGGGEGGRGGRGGLIVAPAGGAPAPAGGGVPGAGGGGWPAPAGGGQGWGGAFSFFLPLRPKAPPPLPRHYCSA